MSTGSKLRTTGTARIADVLLSLPLGCDFEQICADAEELAERVVDTLKALAFWPILNKDMREEHEAKPRKKAYVDMTWDKFLDYHANAGEWRHGRKVSESEAREHAANYPDLFKAITTRMAREGWF